MTNKKNRIVVILLVLISSWGCGTTCHLSIRYAPGEAPLFILPEDRTLKLFLETRGNGSRQWYRMGDCSWVLGCSPSTVVNEAVSTELRRMGITLTGDENKADGRLEVKIRWFGPYGYNPSSAAVILSVSLYKSGSPEPLWHDKLEAGVFSRESAKTLRERGELMEKSASDALARVIRQLSWRPGFVRSISSISRPSRPEGGRRPGARNPG